MEVFSWTCEEWCNIQEANGTFLSDIHDDWRNGKESSKSNKTIFTCESVNVYNLASVLISTIWNAHVTFKTEKNLTVLIYIFHRIY